jgi:ribosomal protein S18 acetylase RimI-like enzyme
MRVTARPATPADLPALAALYEGLRREMTDLHPMWPLADGLDPPVEEALGAALEDERARVVVGQIDEVVVGFLLARIEALLTTAADERVGSVRLVYTDHSAREVGVAEAMLDQVLTDLRALGLSKFDAHVLPGHRLAKNFFEAGGFSARSIVMHHDDHPTHRPGRDPRRL